MARRLTPILVFAFASTAFAPGCVISRPTRPSAREAAQGPAGTPVQGSPVVPESRPAEPEAEDPPPAANKPGAVWLHGYWHWDGVRYVWERGRWESSGVAAP